VRELIKVYLNGIIILAVVRGAKPKATSHVSARFVVLISEKCQGNNVKNNIKRTGLQTVKVMVCPWDTRESNDEIYESMLA